MKILIGLASLGLLSGLLVGCGSDATTGGTGGATSAGASSGGATNAGASSGGSTSAGASSGGAGGSGQAGASGVDPKDCAAVAASQKQLMTALSCKDTSEEMAEGCTLLYSAMFCVSQWEALIRCMNGKSVSDFECAAADNEIDLKTGVCSSEETAFTTCAG
jgi:hypothetical protein